MACTSATRTTYSQRSRWTFTYNNYDRSINYKHFFRTENFNIKRAVWGFETGQNGIPHLQGYCEFNRSVRLGFVKRILNSAHWEGAIGTSTANYLYCTKGQNFESIGNFAKEAACQNDSKKLSNTEVIKGLLTDKTALQTMVGKEYAAQHIYYDKIVRKIRELRSIREIYEDWSSKRLRVWQYVILRRIFNQDERTVTWVYDFRGNNGKSFLANYISILYKFQLLDGQINCRDLSGILNVNAAGICLDICRASGNFVDYTAIECLKNGVMSSGKYAGKCLRFKPMKVIIFSNFPPDATKLSQDRWDILIVGEGILSNLDSDAIVTPSQQYPFIPPPNECELSTGFDLRQYLIDSGVIEPDASALSQTLSQSLAESQQTSKYDYF